MRRQPPDHAAARDAGSLRRRRNRASSRSASTCACEVSWETSVRRLDALRGHRNARDRAALSRRFGRSGAAQIQRNATTPPALHRARGLCPRRGALAVLDGVRLERDRLAPLRARATHVIDTTTLSIHELRRRIVASFGPGAGEVPRMSTRFVSFGFKYGAPVDADVDSRRALSRQPQLRADLSTFRVPIRQSSRTCSIEKRPRSSSPKPWTFWLSHCLATSGKGRRTSRSRSDAPGVAIARWCSPSTCRASSPRRRACHRGGTPRPRTTARRARDRPTPIVLGGGRTEGRRRGRHDASTVTEASFEIVNNLGLHARAATKLVQLASRFACEIRISRDGQKANAKSVMGVLLLCGAKGTVVQISARGPVPPRPRCGRSAG